MAYLKDAFFEFAMTTVSHPKCVVESDDQGQVIFEFGLSETCHCQFQTELYKSTHDPALNVVDGGFRLDQFVTMEYIGRNTLRITIIFPRIGRYKFELNGKEVCQLTSEAVFIVEVSKTCDRIANRLTYLYIEPHIIIS